MLMEEIELCTKGLGLLIDELGNVEAERFVMLMNRDAGDYTEWRRTHLYQNISLEDPFSVSCQRLPFRFFPPPTRKSSTESNGLTQSPMAKRRSGAVLLPPTQS